MVGTDDRAGTVREDVRMWTGLAGDDAPALTRPRRWYRDPRIGVAGIVAATVLTLIAGFLGPSVVTLTLQRRGSWMPPWFVTARPNEWLASSLVWGSIIVGALGLFVCMLALEDGWRPSVKRMLGLGAGLNLATILVPPLTSADVLMYAAYGRLQRIGRDPYDITPAEVFRTQLDVVLNQTERPWTDTPSVYGPIAAFSQLLANWMGGDNMHDIVFWLQVFAVLPFVLTCIGMVWLGHGDPELQSRALLFGICNPLLIWAVTAQAHNEAISVVFAVFAVMAMRKSPFGAGLLIGLAGCGKLSIGLYGVAMLWAYRREPKKALMLCLGAAIPMGLAYGVWQPNALLQVLRNTSYVSAGSWVSPIYGLMTTTVFDQSTAKLLLNLLSLGMLIGVAMILTLVLPWRPAPGLPRWADPRTDPVTVALRTALILSTAWLTTSLYTLAWYDLIAWVPLAIVGPTRLDKLFVARGALLSLAFVPGRAIEMGPALDLVAHRVRDTASPIVQIGVLLALFLWWRQSWWVPRRQARAAGLLVPPSPLALPRGGLRRFLPGGRSR